MQTRVRTLIAVVLALASLSAITGGVRDAGVTDTEIRIGNVMPYSGSLAAFGAIGKAEAAYFELINERGGINGRKVRFISHDDKSDPSTALSLTRDLIEKDEETETFSHKCSYVKASQAELFLKDILGDAAPTDADLWDPALFMILMRCDGR
jgi:hypothetical protein